MACGQPPGCDQRRESGHRKQTEKSTRRADAPQCRLVGQVDRHGNERRDDQRPVGVQHVIDEHRGTAVHADGRQGSVGQRPGHQDHRRHGQRVMPPQRGPRSHGKDQRHQKQEWNQRRPQVGADIRPAKTGRIRHSRHHQNASGGQPQHGRHKPKHPAPPVFPRQSVTDRMVHHDWLLPAAPCLA
jgi:hypothetical protein